jgi:anthranilate synthase component 1
VKEYIRAGDVMQVVPGHRMVSDFDGEPLQVYRALRHLNPSPYLFLVQGQTLENNQPFHIVGSSLKFYLALKMGLQPYVRWQERVHVVKPKKKIWR